MGRETNPKAKEITTNKKTETKLSGQDRKG
jgi:hypothetical protein